ncbi:MAG: FUSC family protein [Firmicutes bacterium]|nr:FUSC family protein [Bacillota bacterium]
MLKPTPPPWRRLWGTGLTTGIVLVIGLMLGHLIWGIWGFMGGFTSLYVQNQPFRSRAVLLALVGLGLAASMALGAFTVVWWHMALALAFVGAGATYFTGAFDIPLPASFMFILTACISAALPLHPHNIIFIRVAAVLGGALVAWLVGMADWLYARSRPLATPVADIYRALAALAAALGTARQSHAAAKAAEAIVNAERVVSGGQDPWLRHLVVQGNALFRALMALASHTSSPLPHEWIRILRQMAAHSRQASPGRLAVTLPPTPTDNPLWRRWRHTMEATLSAFERPTPPAEVPPLYHPSPLEKLGNAFRRDSLVWPAVIRMALAIIASVAIAHLLGIAHPFWVPLTAAAVLEGVSTVVVVERTIQRALGTTFGLLLTLGLTSLHPSTLVDAGLIVLLQLGMLFFIAKNYGISVVFITTLALVIIDAETHPPVFPMVVARFVDTLLGAATGLAAALTLWRKGSSQRLDDAMSRAVRCAGQLFEAALSGRSDLARQRSELLSALFTMRHLYETALGELPPLDPDSVWPQILAIERLGYFVAALNPEKADAPLSLVDKVHPVFEAAAQRLEGHRYIPVPRVPPMPGYSAIEDTLWDLLESMDLAPKGKAQSS